VVKKTPPTMPQVDKNNKIHQIIYSPNLMSPMPKQNPSCSFNWKNISNNWDWKTRICAKSWTKCI